MSVKATHHAIIVHSGMCINRGDNMYWNLASGSCMSCFAYSPQFSPCPCRFLDFALTQLLISSLLFWHTSMKH